MFGETLIAGGIEGVLTVVLVFQLLYIPITDYLIIDTDVYYLRMSI